ncbi:hypothetical protein NP233_g8694 [Leucocoprinus birnbaumii]|uniref:F-box domain-containing protein n=1 Tax=Leucocoprinus birnbaumii TaxID=56174 RepID=A0AAD5VLY6_9AGAR|nr:hypothetical protein NP233_g8694 [Leucocoprinus birnbaumii]
MTKVDVALPQDVLDVITAHVDDVVTLLKLCLVSRALLPQAQRELYREITLIDTGNNMNRGTPGRKETILKFFRTMITRPRLAKNVRRFTYRGRRLQYDWWERMNGALQPMIHLRFFFLEGSQLPLATMLFKDCSFQLREFRWVIDTKLSPTTSLSRGTEEEHLRTFLSTQKEIIALNAPFASIRVPPIICPSLKILVGDTDTIMKVLPGRETVVWLLFRDSQWGAVCDYDAIISPLSRIRCLFLSGHVPRRNLIEFVPYLHNIEIIFLSGTALGVSLSSVADPGFK